MDQLPLVAQKGVPLYLLTAEQANGYGKQRYQNGITSEYFEFQSHMHPFIVFAAEANHVCRSTPIYPKV